MDGGCLLYRYVIADNPKIELVKFDHPSLLEFLHPFSVFASVGHVYYQAHKIIAIEHRFVPPLSLDVLGFVARGAELLDDLQDRISQPLGRNVAPVVELKWQQYLESPPPAAHSLPCL